MKRHFQSYFYILSALFIALMLLSACIAVKSATGLSPTPKQTIPYISPTNTASLVITSPTIPNLSTPVIIHSKTPILPQGTGGTIVLPNEHVQGLVMDDQYIYFSIDPRYIMRQTLDKTQSYHPEVFVKTQPPDPSPDGNLRVSPRRLINQWLYFVDSGDGTKSDYWTLRAIHTVTRSEKMIAKVNGYLREFNVDGDFIALNFISNDAPNCAEENILETIRFSNGQTQEVDRLCTDTGYSWSHISLSGDRLLASQVSPDQQKERKTFLFDLKSGHSDLLSRVLQKPEPVNCDYGLVMSESWIACNITETDTSLYNLTTHQSFSFAESFPSDISHHGVAIQDHWLYWTGSSSGKIYNLERNELLTVVTPKTNEVIKEMIIYGTKVAWLMVRPTSQTWEDIISWMDIP